jgi:hypothetical protein
LDSFRTTDADLRLFLISLKEVPHLIVPELIRTFVKEQEKLAKKTVYDVVKSDTLILFDLLKDGCSYSYAGTDVNGCPAFIKLGTTKQVYLDMELEVKWLF